MRNCVVNGIDWHYEDRGGGTPIVLLHAFPVDHRLYDRQVEELSKWYRIITPDLPGFGQTPGDQPFTVQSVAERLHAFLTAIDALPCVLGGCSMGGYVTFAFEQEYPKDLQGLILIDTRAEGDSPEQRHNRDRLIGLIDRIGSSAIADAMLPKMLSPESKRQQPELEGRLKTVMLNTSPTTLKHALAALRDRPDRMELLPSIGRPTQILVGKDDEVTPVQAAEQIKAGIRHATLTVIPDAGHLSPIENPNAVNEAIRGFMAGIQAKR